MSASDPLCFTCMYVSHTDLTAARRRAVVFNIDNSTVESQSHSAVFTVKLTIVKLCRDNIFHGIPRGSFGNQSSDEKPRDGRVAIRKMI